MAWRRPGPSCRDAVVVVDATPDSATFGSVINVAFTPTWGNEPHHVRGKWQRTQQGLAARQIIRLLPGCIAAERFPTAGTGRAWQVSGRVMLPDQAHRYCLIKPQPVHLLALLSNLHLCRWGWAPTTPCLLWAVSRPTCRGSLMSTSSM